MSPTFDSTQEAHSSRTQLLVTSQERESLSVFNSEPVFPGIFLDSRLTRTGTLIYTLILNGIPGFERGTAELLTWTDTIQTSNLLEIGTPLLSTCLKTEILLAISCYEQRIPAYTLTLLTNPRLQPSFWIELYGAILVTRRMAWSALNTSQNEDSENENPNTRDNTSSVPNTNQRI